MEINFGNQITETEKEIEKYIANHYSFENLPPEIKKYIGNSVDTWKTNVIRYSVRHQLRWKNNLVFPFFFLFFNGICRSNFFQGQKFCN